MKRERKIFGVKFFYDCISFNIDWYLFKVFFYFCFSLKYYFFNWCMCYFKVLDNEYSLNIIDMCIWVYVD